MQWQELRTHLRHLPELDLQRIEKAFRMGQNAHEGQKRKSGEPYFIHPIAVTHMLADIGADADTLIAALLHDTLEDTPLAEDEIRDAFGTAVVDLIQGVTKLSSADLESPRLDEQLESLRKIFTLMQGDVRIMVIKLVDRLHNMQTAAFLAEDRRKLLATETREIYVKIADRLCMQDLRDELLGLSLGVLDPDLTEKLRTLKGRNEIEASDVIATMQRQMHDIPETPSSLEFRHEAKSWEKLEHQHQREGTASSGSSDHAVVIRCTDADACYRVLGIVHQIWPSEAGSFHDSINAPLINGYRGLHTTIILKGGLRVRCKIRTKEMDEYAHSGIAMVCFGSHKGDMFNSLLPWVQRLSPLTQDTKERSEEFWQSLKNDILGDSITIYGSSGEAVSVPKGATALDCAFALLGEDALRAQSIKVNGKDCKYLVSPKNADTVVVSLDSKNTATREWLGWVRTSLATAHIRGVLAQESSNRKLLLGKQLLQDVFTERRKGFIDEFAPAGLDVSATSLGYPSLDAVYIAIADGRLDPSEAYDAIFENQSSSQSARRWSITYNVDPDDLEGMRRMNGVHNGYRSSFTALRYDYYPQKKRGKFTLQIHLEPERLRIFISELRQTGIEDIHVTPYRSVIPSTFALAAVFLLWGLDPVVAHYLLTKTPASFIDLTIVRFWCLFGMSGIFLLWRSRKSALPQARLSLININLWFSVILLLLVGLSTYAVLRDINPISYTLPMTAAGVTRISMNLRRNFSVVLGWLIMLLGVILLISQTPAWTTQNVLLMVLAVAAFSAFWIFSDRYKLKEQVSARVAQYFFILSLLCAVITLPLLPLSTLSNLSPSIFAGMVAFAVFVSGLPYFLTYHVLNARGIELASGYSFVVIPITLFAQILVFGSVNGFTLLISMIVTLGALLPTLLGRQRALA